MKKLYLRLYGWILPLLLLTGFLLRVINLDYNSPLVDEAQYIVLGQKVFAGRWEQEAPFSWVGGMPLFYPPLAAMFSMAGGVIGARFFSVVLGTLAIYLLFELVRHLDLISKSSRNAVGFLAAGLLAILAIPVYLSRIATYDMLSYTLLLAGFVCLQKSLTFTRSSLWQRENYYFFSATLLFASFLAKYFTLVMLPYMIVWGVWQLRHQDKRFRSRFVKYFFVPLVTMVGIYVLVYFRALSAFLSNQVTEPVPVLPKIMDEFTRFTLPISLVSLAGLIWLTVVKRELTWLIFWGGVVLVPVVHLIFNSSASFHQQAFIILLLGLPLAAYFLYQVIQAYRIYGVVVVFLFFVWVGWDGRREVNTLGAAWTNTDRVMEHLKSLAKPTDTILTSEDDITVMKLPQVPYTQITGLFYFEYDGRSGAEAYQKALEDRFFNIVLINDTAHEDVTARLQPPLETNYQLVFSEPPFSLFVVQEPIAQPAE